MFFETEKGIIYFLYLLVGNNIVFQNNLPKNKRLIQIGRFSQELFKRKHANFLESRNEPGRQHNLEMLATLTLDLFTCLRKYAIGPQLTEIERAGLVEIVRSSHFQSYDYSLVR
jgi:hypothetical protein